MEQLDLVATCMENTVTDEFDGVSADPADWETPTPVELTPEGEAARLLYLNARSLSSRRDIPSNLAFIFDDIDSLLDGIEAGIEAQPGDKQRHTRVIICGQRTPIGDRVEDWLRAKRWNFSEDIWVPDSGGADETFGCRELVPDYSSPNGQSDIGGPGRRWHEKRIEAGLYAMPYRHDRVKDCLYCGWILGRKISYRVMSYLSRGAVRATLTILACPKSARRWPVSPRYVAVAERWLSSTDLEVVNHLLAGETIEREVLRTLLEGLGQLQQQINTNFLKRNVNADELRAIPNWLRAIRALAEDALYWRSYSQGDMDVVRHDFIPDRDGKLAGHFVVLREHEKAWQNELEPIGVVFRDWSEIAPLMLERPGVAERVDEIRNVGLRLQAAGRKTTYKAVADELDHYTADSLRKWLQRYPKTTLKQLIRQ